MPNKKGLENQALSNSFLFSKGEIVLNFPLSRASRSFRYHCHSHCPHLFEFAHYVRLHSTENSPNPITKSSSNPNEIKKGRNKSCPFLFSKGEIRTLDLTGMSRALSPTELPCHKHFYYYMLKKKLQYLSKK